jgi:hypothetical protein
MGAKMVPARGESGDLLVGEAQPDLDAISLLKVVLDENRLAILGLLALRPCTMPELVDALLAKRIPPAKHVAQLVEVGLLVQEDGERYALNVAQLQRWKRELFARPAMPKPESSDEQVLATFVRGGRMWQYPAQPAKRLVLLRWMATHFEPGRNYTEREVNELLAGHSEDHATLRRYLVDHNLLMRHEGIYRRVGSVAEEEAAAE